MGDENVKTSTSTGDPGLPPNLVVVAVSLTLFQLLEILQRHRIGPSFTSYKRLTYRDRFDWDRRALNLLFQVLQTFFNGYLLALDKPVTSDVLYGYSRIAHAGFLVIVAFYIYDTSGMVMHPLPPSTTPVWIVHHFITVALLIYDVSFKRTSAFPAATFLISSAGHIPNELRWFLAAFGTRDVRVLNATRLLCGIVVFVTCGLPPPYLLVKAAQQLHISVYNLVFFRMRIYCVFVFLLIYVPHVFLIVIQFKRICAEWNKPPKPFRQKRVD